MRTHGAKVLGISTAMMLATFVAPTTRAGDGEAVAVMNGVGNMLGGLADVTRSMNGVPQNVYIQNGYPAYAPMYPNPYVQSSIIYNQGYYYPQGPSGFVTGNPSPAYDPNAVVGGTATSSAYWDPYRGLVTQRQDTTVLNSATSAGRAPDAGSPIQT